MIRKISLKPNKTAYQSQGLQLLRKSEKVGTLKPMTKGLE